MDKSSRILIVDDDGDIRRVLQRFFTDAGHEVRVAPDGKAGLDEVRDWQPHVVLLDLEMPNLNGLDTLRYINAEHSNVSVVAFSGHAAADHLGADARRLGAKDFLAKPFDLDNLGAIVDNLVKMS